MSFAYTNTAGELILDDAGKLMTGDVAGDCCCEPDTGCCEIVDCTDSQSTFKVKCEDIGNPTVGNAVQLSSGCYEVTATGLPCDGSEVPAPGSFVGECNSCGECPCECDGCYRVKECDTGTTYEIPCEDLSKFLAVGDTFQVDGNCFEILAVNEPCGQHPQVPQGEIILCDDFGPGCDNCPCDGAPCCCTDPPMPTKADWIFPACEETPGFTCDSCGDLGGTALSSAPDLNPNCQFNAVFEYVAACSDIGEFELRASVTLTCDSIDGTVTIQRFDDLGTPIGGSSRGNYTVPRPGGGPCKGTFVLDFVATTDNANCRPTDSSALTVTLS